MLLHITRMLARMNPLLAVALPILLFWFILSLVSNVVMNAVRPSWLTD